MFKKDKEGFTDDATYVHHEFCHNCGHLLHLAIPRGTRVSDYLTSYKCDYCGVKLKESPYDFERIRMSMPDAKMRVYMDEMSDISDDAFKLMDEMMQYYWKGAPTERKKKSDGKG